MASGQAHEPRRSACSKCGRDYVPACLQHTTVPTRAAFTCAIQSFSYLSNAVLTLYEPGHNHAKQFMFGFKLIRC